MAWFEIADLSSGLPPFGRVPGLGLRISDLKSAICIPQSEIIKWRITRDTHDR